MSIITFILFFFYSFSCSRTHPFIHIYKLKFWQFNDAEDTGNIPAVVNNSSEINSFDTANFTWTRINFFKSLHNVAVTVTGDNTELLGKNGKIKLKVRANAGTMAEKLRFFFLFF